MVKKIGGSTSRANPLSREEQRVVRARIFAMIRNYGDRFSGAIRALADETIKGLSPARPFHSRGVIEQYIGKLEKEGVLSFRWGKAKNYDVVKEITLVREEGDPPRRKIATRTVVSRDAIEQRRMETLAYLAHHGPVDGAFRLSDELTAAFSGHRHGTFVGDLKALEARKLISKTLSPTSTIQHQRIVIEIKPPQGRRALTAYRKAHDGRPIYPAGPASDHHEPTSVEPATPTNGATDTTPDVTATSSEPPPPPRLGPVRSREEVVAAIAQTDAEIQSLKGQITSLEKRRAQLAEILQRYVDLERLTASMFSTSS